MEKFLKEKWNDLIVGIPILHWIPSFFLLWMYMCMRKSQLFFFLFFNSVDIGGQKILQFDWLRRFWALKNNSFPRQCIYKNKTNKKDKTKQNNNKNNNIKNKQTSKQTN